MAKSEYDIIVIGAGSAGLSVGLFMNKVGFKVLMLAKSDKGIGGDCLNEGCIPSKALIHVSRIAHHARLAGAFGLEVKGTVDMGKAIDYVYSKQEIIRHHENAAWLKEQGIDVALGTGSFVGKREIEVNGNRYSGKNIVIATGSRPRKLELPGIEAITYIDNESIFHTRQLPQRLLVIGGGPIGIEMAQTLSRLGSKVTVVDNGDMILAHDDAQIAAVLLAQLQKEGIKFIFNAAVQRFTSPNECIVKAKSGAETEIAFDAVFVAVGRQLNTEDLQLSNAGIEVKDHKIVVDEYLCTTNKNVFVCGDIAGDLQFSHAAEFHARILLNNFFSPLKKKLNNDHMSWVTFTDPEVATFGIGEKQLEKRKIDFLKVEKDFLADDRAIVDNYQYGKMILYISKGSWLKKKRILGGTMVAPGAGELVQELILANTSGLSIDAIFNKIYPYPVASRVNQSLVLQLKQSSLTSSLKKILKTTYKFFG